MINKIIESLNESIKVKERTKKLANEIARIAELCIGVLRNGGKIVLFGNGGSAADAQHIAAEMVGKFKLERRALPAMALTTNTSILTAVANDLGFEETFARQVEALVTEKDIVMGISTSGESNNVIKAMILAKGKGAKTAALVGRGGGRLAEMVDVPIIVPSNSTPRIQEAHITIGHIICGLIEEELLISE